MSRAVSLEGGVAVTASSVTLCQLALRARIPYIAVSPSASILVWTPVPAMRTRAPPFWKRNGCSVPSGPLASLMVWMAVHASAMMSRNCRLLTWMLRSDGDSGPPPCSASGRPAPPKPVDLPRGRAISTTFNCFRNVATGIRTLPHRVWINLRCQSC